jgi:catechol 2,3-dioxygenase-like lactoylglutathione lyase family enzyme
MDRTKWRQASPRRYLRLGPCYVAIAPAAGGEAKRIDHIGIGIANFNASALKKSLEAAGFKVRESDLGLFVRDPDGTSIQIWADQSWKQLRNTAADAGPKQEVLFHPRGMHHIAIQTGDSARSAEFYRMLFGEPIEMQGNPSAPQPIFWLARPGSFSTIRRQERPPRSITSACRSITLTPLPR